MDPGVVLSWSPRMIRSHQMYNPQCIHSRTGSMSGSILKEKQQNPRSPLFPVPFHCSVTNLTHLPSLRARLRRRRFLRPSPSTEHLSRNRLLWPSLCAAALSLPVRPSDDGAFNSDASHGNLSLSLSHSGQKELHPSLMKECEDDSQVQS